MVGSARGKERGMGGRVGKNPGFFKKPNPLGFLGFYWAFLGFIGLFWVLLFLRGYFYFFLFISHIYM